MNYYDFDSWKKKDLAFLRQYSWVSTEFPGTVRAWVGWEKKKKLKKKRKEESEVYKEEKIRTEIWPGIQEIVPSLFHLWRSNNSD